MCGERRGSDERFCAGCGFDFKAGGRLSMAAIPESDPVAADDPLFKPEVTKGVDCPNGSHPGFVRSVSAVYFEGVSTTTLSGQTSGITHDGDHFSHSVGSSTMSGTSRSALSTRLLPPSEPTYENPYGTGTKAFFVLCVLFFYAYFIPVIFMFIVNSGKQKLATVRHAEVDRLHPLWLAAMERWNNAYYCSKCDGVFLPGRSQFIPAGQARETLFALQAA